MVKVITCMQNIFSKYFDVMHFIEGFVYRVNLFKDESIIE